MSQRKGRDNIEALTAYLASIDALPAKDGKVFVQGVAAAAGIDRQALYRNPVAKALLATAAKEKVLVSIEERITTTASANERALEKRVRSLEARNAALAAENADLRARLIRFEHMEELMIDGRRVIP